LVETVLQLWEAFDDRFWGEEVATFLDALESVLLLTVELLHLHTPVIQALVAAIDAYGESDAWGLAKMLPYLSGSMHTTIQAEVLRRVQAEADNYGRVATLLSIVDYLEVAEQGGVVDEALAAIYRLGKATPSSPRSGYWQAKYLFRLIPRVEADKQQKVLRDALHIAQHIPDDHTRAWCLQELVLDLAKLGYVVEAVDTALSIRDDYFRAWALRNAAPSLDPVLLQRTLQAVPIFAQPTHRAWVLEALIPQLAKHGQPEKALRLVQALPDAPGPHGLNLRADALAHLASYLAPNLVTEALPVVHTIRDDWSRLHALVWFGPKLVQLGALDEALRDSRKLNCSRSGTLSASYLEEGT